MPSPDRETLEIPSKSPSEAKAAVAVRDVITSEILAESHRGAARHDENEIISLEPRQKSPSGRRQLGALLETEENHLIYSLEISIIKSIDARTAEKPR